MNPIVRGYLILYNLSLSLGWAYVLYLAIERRADHTKIWAAVEIPLKICQTAAVMEVCDFVKNSTLKISTLTCNCFLKSIFSTFQILHAAIGIVKSNVLLTFFQVFSRVYVVWCVLEISPPSTVSIGVPMLMFCWDITEIIRYGYYFFNLIGLPSILVWFRYRLTDFKIYF